MQSWKRSRISILQIDIPEFATNCPLTGQPDFATLILEYMPGRQCVELKAYKLYLWHFSHESAFHWGAGQGHTARGDSTHVGVVIGTVLLLRGVGCRASGQALIALPWRYLTVFVGEQIVRLGMQTLLTQALAWRDSRAMIAVLSGLGPFYVWLISLALGRTPLRDPHLPRYAIALLGLLLGAILMAR